MKPRDTDIPGSGDSMIRDLAYVDFSRLIRTFPSLVFFNEIVADTVGRTIAGMLEHGVEPGKLQDIIDNDRFIIMVAGSVYAQLHNNPHYGCDDEEGRFRGKT
jgi:hypothetical protein